MSWFKYPKLMSGGKCRECREETPDSTEAQ